MYGNQLFTLKIVNMKIFSAIVVCLTAGMVTATVSAQNDAGSTAATKKNETAGSSKGKKLFIDVHHLGAGKVSYDAVAKAHAKDLATEGKYSVEFIKYWVDSAKGDVYCLSSAFTDESIRKTHAEAHGLLPDYIYSMTDGAAAPMNGGKNLYLDIHELGAGKVTPADVAGAHQKDLMVENKYGVNFINYWVNTKDGVVMCLSEAPDSSAVINTHREAHGLIPSSISAVKQGQ